MDWALAGVTLVAVAVVFRRVLRLDEGARRPHALPWLRQRREQVYQPVALEIETQTVILGISLNEALGERGEGHIENAWRLVGLALCQWNRLAGDVTSLLNAIEANISSSRSALHVRNIDPQRFMSRTMMECLRMRDTLDQLVFRSRIRYQVNVRVLRRAVESLGSDLRNACRETETTADRPAEVWDLLDPAFHDFDLIIKESLLSFRALLVALPESALDDLASDLKSVVSHSVRSRSAARVR
jgi:hypothetical protein